MIGSVQHRLITFKLKGKTFKIYADPASAQVCQQDLCRKKIWEPWLTEYILDKLRPDSVFIDAGASVGWFTLLAAVHCPQGHIIAFEPHTQRHRMLVSSVAANGFTNVVSIRAALSDMEGHTTLGGRADAQMGKPGEEIRTVRLDETLKILGIDHVDLVKMDIEGAEVRALQGMDKTLRTPDVKMAIEVHPNLMIRYGDASADLYKLMESHGFRSRNLHSNGRYKVFEK